MGNSRMQKIGKHYTKVIKMNGKTIVQYHATNVVTMYDNGAIFLNTGGWLTRTTKTRMNQASNQFGLGYVVKQNGGKWYAEHNGKKLQFAGDICIINGKGLLAIDDEVKENSFEWVK